MDDHNQTAVLDAEIVTDETAVQSVSNPDTTQATSATVPQPGAFDINAYNATLEIVRRRLTIIEKAKEELKQFKEMHDDALGNDPLYKKADDLVKEATQKRKDIQTELSKQPAIAEVVGKVKDLKEQMRSNQESLAEELMEYYRTAGVTEIEDENGNVQEFIISIRLKPKVMMDK
jgi:hypothetical protein